MFRIALTSLVASIVTTSAMAYTYDGMGRRLYPGDSVEVGNGIVVRNLGHEVVDLVGIDYRLSRSGPPQPPRPEPPRPPGPPRPQPPPGRVDFTLPTPINGVAFCDDTTMGGQPNAAVVGCVDVGRGNNHACEMVRNGCRAVEGNGNGGYAQCQTQCQSAQTEFVVRNYGEPFTSCTDIARGGRPGAQVLACIDVGRGNNHSCRMQVGGCLAVEGDGNGGYAACEARCK